MNSYLKIVNFSEESGNINSTLDSFGLEKQARNQLEIANMTTENELSETKSNKLDGAVLEYWGSIQKALEIESGKLKERVERDSSQILAGAEEEAKKIVAQAKQEAGLESERIISEAKEEAGKIVAQARQAAGLESERIITRARDEAEQAAGEYREKVYAEVLQESSKVINNTREKVSQVITEIIERSITRAKDDFSRVVSEARLEMENETSQILAQASESARDNFSETNTTLKTEFESLNPEIANSETEEQPCTETNDKAEESSQQTSEEAVTPVASVSKETDLDTPSVEVKLDTQNEIIDDTKLYEGRLKLEIVCSPYKELNWSLQDELAQVPGVKVISRDSYNRGNSKIMANIVELVKPMPLLKTIKAAMKVKNVTEHKGCIVITPN